MLWDMRSGFSCGNATRALKRLFDFDNGG
jgi:hypothetical protein